ncbi:MAG: hypothetical protein O6945_04970 [Gammaproteobacteria bacterium]|nr:hypothetical protein [Gammaproteobacteria bacterium]
MKTTTNIYLTCPMNCDRELFIADTMGSELFIEGEPWTVTGINPGFNRSIKKGDMIGFYLERKA